MEISYKPILFFCLLISLFLPSYSQCSYTFSNRIFQSCSALPVLNANLHWTYTASNNSIQIAYRATQSTGRWIAWAINPTSTRMQGSQALVAFQHSNGTMVAYTTPINTMSPTMLPGPLSFPVTSIAAEHVGGQMIIYATVTLPSNSLTINQVWQEGPVSSDVPQIHPTSGNNVRSMGTLNLQSGGTTAAGGVVRIRRKNAHGVLAAISWGTLMPIGIIIARYLKVFKAADPAWFYLHAACQTSAYIVGVAAWGTGLKLGSESAGVKYGPHRNIGIALFCLGTLQVFALLLRPKKDHKYRLYWNIYHHATGYTVIILSIVNIFKGFDILEPEKKWKRAYIGILIALGAIALVLEAITWPIVIKRKKEDSEKSHHGANGVNGYGVRHQGA
ncbi:cytochrome b561 and DOMON domain-containing protein At5g47530 [Magnolia sinica]|uniref:cytochrome b561 and DOMON domain-containing protein At5g47530 n=1 Tax=Magnolia sinica TaxID=86752 RepID=UPI0026596E9D|nr:cytochrome b561 and DOMON domain-containing protein At5g47530 [Magnolia sinica]